MLLVTDLYGEQLEGRDWYFNTGRAICQHCAIVCIVLFYATFYLDFGRLEFFIVQGNVEKKVRKKSKKH